MKVTSDGSIHVELEAHDTVKPCPFCGLRPELANTWTASYWLACQCGAEMHDAGSAGDARRQTAHRASARRVLKQWNERYE